MNIQYLTPTKILMGKNCVAANAAVFAGMGKKALIVTGRRSAKASGALQDVTGVLDANGQTYAVYDRVMSNPTIACVYDGAAFARDEGCDFVVGIGGGSPMDAAKAMALLSRQDIPEEKLYDGGYTSDVLPMVFIPTTAGTGSEVTQYSILTNDKIQSKASISSPLLFPAVAILDAKYTEKLSYATTVNTAIDALSHAVEGMLSVRANPLADCIAAESIRRIFACIDALIQKNITTGVREELLFASTLAGLVIANTGTTAVHAMGYSLTYFKDIDHGRANGLLLGGFLKLVEKSFPEKIAEILRHTSKSTVDEFCGVLKALLGDVEALALAETARFTEIACKAKNISNCIFIPSKEEIEALYNASFGL